MNAYRIFTYLLPLLLVSVLHAQEGEDKKKKTGPPMVDGRTLTSRVPPGTAVTPNVDSIQAESGSVVKGRQLDQGANAFDHAGVDEGGLLEQGATVDDTVAGGGDIVVEPVRRQEGEHRGDCIRVTRDVLVLLLVRP